MNGNINLDVNAIHTETDNRAAHSYTTLIVNLDVFERMDMQRIENRNDNCSAFSPHYSLWSLTLTERANGAARI